MALKEYLKRHRVKNSEFAELIGCTPNYVSRIIAGARPSPTLAKRIEHVTRGEIKAADLIFPTDEPGTPTEAGPIGLQAVREMQQRAKSHRSHLESDFTSPSEARGNDKDYEQDGVREVATG